MSECIRRNASIGCLTDKLNDHLPSLVHLSGIRPRRSFVMSFQQIRDILKKILIHHKELHACIAEEIAKANGDFEGDGRKEWITKYVAIQSGIVTKALSQLQSQANDRTLDTWRQYVPDEEIQRSLQKMRSIDDPSWEDLLELVQSFDQAVRNLCWTLADQSSIPDNKEMFESLGRVSQSFLEHTTWGMRSGTSRGVTSDADSEPDDLMADDTRSK